MIKKHVLFAFGILAAVTAACGGGGGGSVSPSTINGTSSTPIATATTPASTGGTTGATTAPTVAMGLTVFIPKATTASSTTRKAQYISPNSQSFTMKLLTVNGVAQPDVTTNTQGPFNLVASASNPACTVGTTGTTCTFQIAAPPGTDIFLANTFSSTDAKSGALGSGAIILSVRQNATNSASLALTGPVAQVQLVTATSTLYNGNPIQSSSSGSSSSFVRHSAASVRASMAANANASRATAALRSPNAVSTSTPNSTPGPVALTSRMFVIALDAAGNQIINPTTFDIPIALKLNLNGAPAGSLTLGVTYAGLTNEPTSPASTTADGGTVTVYAPSDVVTLTVNSTVNTNTPYAPSVVAQYTPQGGTPQTTTPTTYQLYLPPPAAYFSGSISYNLPWTGGDTQPLTFTITNTGTLPATNPTSFDVYNYYGSFLDTTGTSSDWTCSVNSGYVHCDKSSALNVAASTQIVIHELVANQSFEQIYAYIDNNSIVNSYNELQLTANIPVGPGPTPVPQPTLAASVEAIATPFYVDVPLSISVDTSNIGGGPTSGTVTVMHTFPSGAVTYQSSSGTGWSCASALPSVTCTTNAVAAPSATFPPVTITVKPQAALLNMSLTDSITVSGGGSGYSPNVSIPPAIVRSPLLFSAAPGFAVGALNGIGFASGSTNANTDATLSFGYAPSAPVSGTVQITELASGGGTLNIIAQDCISNGFIDSAFGSSFPRSAPAAGSTTTVPFNVNYGLSPGQCYVTIADSSGHHAAINLLIAGSTGITVQSKKRTSGATR